MKLDPKVRRAFETMTFDFDGDTGARRELERRLAERGRREDVISYSELVRGVVFHLPSVRGGNPVELGMPEWTDLHRAIIGGNLGRISRDSYLLGGFLASALAVSKMDGAPSQGFKELADQAGLLSKGSDLAFLGFWTRELQRAYQWYAANPNYLLV